MRKPSSRDENSRKEIKDRDDHPRRNSYYRDDRSRKGGDRQKKYDFLKDKIGSKNRRSSSINHERYRKEKDRRSFNSLNLGQKMKYKPRSDKSSEKQAPYKSKATTEIERVRNDVKKSREEINRLTKEHSKYMDSRFRAKEAKVMPGNTNYEAWANKYVELETEKSNIRRHERVGKILKHQIPGVSQALYEQAAKLKAKPEEIVKQMAQLKSEGKHDEELKEAHDFQVHQYSWHFYDQVNKHADMIYNNEEKIRKHEEGRSHTSRKSRNS